MQRTLRQIFQDDPRVRLCPPSSGQDPDFASLTSDEIIPPEDAEVVEDSEYRLHDVPEVGHSGFTHFLDGAQRHWRAGYIGMFPLRIAHTSAALLERMERSVQAPDAQTYSGALEFIQPVSSAGILHELAERLPIQTVPAIDEESPLAVRDRIVQKIEDLRKQHEQTLVARFQDGRLLIDGGIGEAMRLLDGPFIVGLVKSHQRQYFRSVDRRRLMLEMRAGQRTSVFLRPSSDRQGKPAYSFYLKLRDGRHEPPTFGLVRIETPPEEAYLRMADAIAGWVLHERCPLSLPDPRFHVLPYPIHLVEEHLKARQPSDAAIRGIIGL